MSTNPVLSIVIAVRNDNYGGDFTQRLQRGLDWNTRWLEHFRIRSEFVLVNWNPIKENPPIQEQIDWQAGLKYVSCRILEVSAEHHQHYLDQNLRDPVPMFEFLAKNVGVRRAMGEYVLCINADIMVHRSIFRLIAANRLEKMAYYRANRLDFEAGITSTETQMIQAGSFVSLKGRMYEFRPGLNKELQYQYFMFRNNLRLQWEFWKLRNSGFCNRFSISVIYDNGDQVAHCLNSGDFMLMHRSHWLRLKGYSEYVFSAVHTDAIFTMLAHSQVKDVVFDRPILHQHHERRYSWNDMANDARFAQTYQLLKEIAKVVREDQPVERYLNDDEWGLGGHDLPEITINDGSDG